MAYARGLERYRSCTQSIKSLIARIGGKARSNNHQLGSTLASSDTSHLVDPDLCRLRRRRGGPKRLFAQNPECPQVTQLAFRRPFLRVG